MDGALLITGSAVLAAPLGLAWVEIVRRHEDTMARRRACDHEWGPPEPVDPGNRGVIGYKSRCHCGSQRDVNIDGSPYVPEWKRPRRG